LRFVDFSRASLNTTSPNIGGTDAWAVLTSSFGGRTVPQPPLSLHPWLAGWMDGWMAGWLAGWMAERMDKIGQRLLKMEEWLGGKMH